MEFQILKKNNKKKWIIGSIIGIALIATITFIGTRAKYKNTNTTPIAKGTINYKHDFELIAVKLQNENGTYDDNSNIPTSGYTLNTEKSVCKVGNEKQEVTIAYENGKINILGLSKKGTKCEVYLDKFYTKDLILKNNTIDRSRATGPFNEPFTDDTAGKIFSAEDDDGTTYFFAGSNPNNWVKFGTNKESQDLYWRIIRINGDGSIRLIYNGPTTDQEGETTQIGKTKFSHIDAYWNNNTDNSYVKDNAYVGYMYGAVGSSTYTETHANINSSGIKEYLDTWYEENLKVNYGQYIDINAGFCGDRTVDNYDSDYTGDGAGTAKTQYGPNKRVWNTYTPTYTCVNQANDLYTLTGSTKGNKALTNPIGLITADEAYYAGGYKYVSGLTYNYWLKTGQNYWTMSPYYFNGSIAYVFDVLGNGSVTHYDVYNVRGSRPVINLKADTLTIGKGTTTEPYKIA